MVWLDDSPQHARFLSAAEKQALIGELAREEEKKVTSRLSDALRNGRVWQLALEGFRRDYFANLLMECQGNRSEAARRAGMSRQALLYQLKELGLSKSK